MHEIGVVLICNQNKWKIGLSNEILFDYESRLDLVSFVQDVAAAKITVKQINVDGVMQYELEGPDGARINHYAKRQRDAKEAKRLSVRSSISQSQHESSSDSPDHCASVQSDPDLSDISDPEPKPSDQSQSSDDEKEKGKRRKRKEKKKEKKNKKKTKSRKRCKKPSKEITKDMYPLVGETMDYVMTISGKSFTDPRWVHNSILTQKISQLVRRKAYAPLCEEKGLGAFGALFWAVSVLQGKLKVIGSYLVSSRVPWMANNQLESTEHNTWKKKLTAAQDPQISQMDRKTKPSFFLHRMNLIDVFAELNENEKATFLGIVEQFGCHTLQWLLGMGTVDEASWTRAIEIGLITKEAYEGMDKTQNTQTTDANDSWSVLFDGGFDWE